MPKITALLVYFCIFLFALGCSSEPIQYVTATPGDSLGTAVHSAGEQSTLPPLSVARQSSAEPTPVLASPAPTLPTPCEINPDGNIRPQYVVQAVLNWAEHSVEVEQQFTYINTTNVSLNRLLFVVEPNRQIGFFVLHGVSTQDGRPIEDIVLSAAGQMTVPLPETLHPNCQVTLHMAFTVRLPPVLDGYYGHLGYLGYTDRQVNLGHWLPVVALYHDDWYAPRVHVVGEQTITESSDFDVTLQVTNAPPTIDVAGAGQMRRLEENQWRFELARARDLAISVGNGFHHTSQLVENNRTIIELYYFPESTAATGLNAAGHVLDSAAAALILYEELFGVPYPYERLVIVEGDFADGMEFSALVFVSEAWFRTWRGEPNEWLTVITVHEVSHQWWYALVGNDPAANPYLDEAFATYSEYLYFQRYYGDKTEWWWDFRVRAYPVDEGLVDSDIYRYDNGRPYINAVYLRGALMLHSMRMELGDEAFFAWVSSYVQANQYRIATPQDLWGALPADRYAESLPLRQQYFATWGVLPETSSAESVEIAPTSTPSG